MPPKDKPKRQKKKTKAQLAEEARQEAETKAASLVAELAAIEAIPKVDRLFAVDWVCQRREYEYFNSSDDFDQFTWQTFTKDLIHKCVDFDPRILTPPVDLEFILNEQQRIEETERIRLEAKAVALAEAEEVYKLAEEEARLRTEAEEAKKNAKKKPAPEVAKSSSTTKLDPKAKGKSNEPEVTVGAFENTLEGDDVSIKSVEVTPEEIESQIFLEQQIREEALENEQMKKEEDTIKKNELLHEYQICVDYIQEEQRTYILLEFIFLQYHFCKNKSLTYEQMRSFLYSVYDCFIYAMFDIKPCIMSADFESSQEPLSSAYFVELMMEYQKKYASYDVAIASMEAIAVAVTKAQQEEIAAAEAAAIIEAANAAAAAAAAEGAKSKGKNKNASATVTSMVVTSARDENILTGVGSATSLEVETENITGPFVVPPVAKLIEVLLPEYIESEIVSQYTSTFVNHLSAYKLAFTKCRFMKNAWVGKTW